MINKPIRVKKGEIPNSEVIVDPDTPKHPRIRYALYVFALLPLIILVLVGGEVGPPLLFSCLVFGVAYNCVRPGKSFRLVWKNKENKDHS
jgi:hypothetical protein